MYFVYIILAQYDVSACPYTPCMDVGIIPYSRKYWRELNLAVGSYRLSNVLVDLNLVVQYGIAIRI